MTSGRILSLLLLFGVAPPTASYLTSLSSFLQRHRSTRCCRRGRLGEGIKAQQQASSWCLSSSWTRLRQRQRRAVADATQGHNRCCCASTTPTARRSGNRRMPTTMFSINNEADHDMNVGTAIEGQDQPPQRRLEGCVCLVTGASRGIGKGIALELGREGATVYITGTSSSSPSSLSTTASTSNDKYNNNKYATSPDVGGPGTIELTAQQVTEAGGKGIPVYCNHAVDDDVQKLMDRISQEQNGRLDILVNNVFRIPPGGAKNLRGKFWEKQQDGVWDYLHTVGLRSHYVATCKAMPLLLKSRDYLSSLNQNNDNNNNNGNPKVQLPRPFIAMISSFGGLTYTFNVAYGVGKAALDRMAKDMAVELIPENICVVSFWPGVVLTERTQVAVATGDWDKLVGLPPLDDTNSESPQFTGKAIVATALDPNNLSQKAGTYQVVAELAEEYGFTDNGRRPPSIRSLRFLLPSYAFDEKLRTLIPSSLIPDWKLPFWIMAQGAPPPSSTTSDDPS